MQKENNLEIQNQDYNQITIDGYNRESDNWNRTRQEFWGEIADEIKDILHKTFDIKDKINILDAGCGNGRLLKFLCDYKGHSDINIGLEKESNVNGKLVFDYIGFDPSHKLVEFAKSNFPKYKNNFYVKSLLESDFIQNILGTLNVLKENNLSSIKEIYNKKFDFIFSIAVFHHFNKKDFASALRNLKMVKHDKGYIIMTLWRRDKAKNKEEILNLFNNGSKRYVYNYTEDELRELFQNSGCEILEMKVLERNEKLGVSNIYCVLR